MFLSSGWWSVWMQVIVVDVAILLTIFALVCFVKMHSKRN